jgi:ribonuclease E
MVQVEKEERGNKGAALTSFVSLAGRYLVLMPNNPRGGGVSRRVEGEERQELRETMDKLDLPQGMSVIARTAGIGRNVEELQWDLNYLMQLWRAIEGAGKSASGAFLIYQESSLVIRAIRDYFQPDIGEILIDTDDIYDQAQQFMSHVMPDMVHRVKRYSDDVPLFSRFQIEHQIETAYSRTVPLPSGGAIVIDHTEALVSVDVNSARATRGSDIETTAFNTNCEAADEVARQLRLRDLGGLIVIDFIDMEVAKNQREVEQRLKDALHHDRARVQMGKISRFGLMELSRQRLRPSLSEGSHVTCPRCSGTGHIRDTESSALQVLRIIQEEAMKENSATIHVQVPVDVAAFLLNEKRGEVLKIENRHRISVILIPNKHLDTPHYKLERIKHDDPRLEEAKPATRWPSKPKPTWPTASARRKKPSRARKPWSRPSPRPSRRRWSSAPQRTWPTRPQP